MAGERYKKWGVSQAYGAANSVYSKGYNRGTDYPMPAGTPVEIDIPGTVIAVSEHPQWGLYIQVRDDNGYIEQYSHLSSANVSVGQRVEAGDIGGNSGYSGFTIPAGPDGAHLDFMILDPSGNDINPDSYQGTSTAPVPTGLPNTGRVEGDDMKPPKGWTIEQHEDGEYWRSPQGDLYNPQTGWLQDASGNTDTVSLDDLYSYYGQPDTGSAPAPTGTAPQPTGGKTPKVGDVQTIDLPGGRKLDQIYAEVQDRFGKVTGYEWQDLGQPYWPKEPKEPKEPYQGTTPEERAREAAAERAAERAADKAKEDARNAANKALQDAKSKVDKEITQMEIEAREAIARMDDAFKRDNLAEARRQFDIKNALDEKIADARIKSQDLNDQLAEAGVTGYYKGAPTLPAQIATGYVDGKPTIDQQRIDQEKREWEARIANEPGNVYNYLFRSRGMEPPQPIGEAARPWWENYSNERLMRFPDEELMTLPPAVLAGFPNAFFLERPALLAFLPPERIRGEGQWQGTGFAQDVIDKHGKGAPVPKEVQNVGKPYQAPTAPQPQGTAPQPVTAPTPSRNTTQPGSALGPPISNYPSAVPEAATAPSPEPILAARAVERATPTPAPQPMGQDAMIAEASAVLEQIKQRRMAGVR